MPWPSPCPPRSDAEAGSWYLWLFKAHQEVTCSQDGHRAELHAVWGWFSRQVMSRLLRPRRLQPARFLCPWNSLGKNIEVGSHFLLHGLFPTQGSNPNHLHCRQILYHLSQKESPQDRQSLLQYRHRILVQDVSRFQCPLRSPPTLNLRTQSSKFLFCFTLHFFSNFLLVSYAFYSTMFCLNILYLPILKTLFFVWHSLLLCLALFLTLSLSLSTSIY